MLEFISNVRKIWEIGIFEGKAIRPAGYIDEPFGRFLPH